MKTWSNCVRVRYEVIKYFSLLFFLLAFPFQGVNMECEDIFKQRDSAAV